MDSETENETTDRVITSMPQIIFDGNCDHYYSDGFLDPEGVYNSRCQKCPMGLRFLPLEGKIKNGKFKRIYK